MSSAGVAVGRPPAVAGDFILHPVVLVSLGLLVVNDHYWKGRGPGVITGKLSDVAGLVVTPAVVAILIVGVATLLHRPVSRRALAWTSVVVVGVGFTLVKASGFLAAGYSAALTHVYDVARLGTGPDQMIVRSDATDLLTLPALVLAWWVIAGSSGSRDRGARSVDAYAVGK
ncbi:MAG: hypothetical protein ACK4V6_14550, partial [Microthrixaceae bacterium]